MSDRFCFGKQLKHLFMYYGSERLLDMLSMLNAAIYIMESTFWRRAAIKIAQAANNDENNYIVDSFIWKIKAWAATLYRLRGQPCSYDGDEGNLPWAQQILW